MGTRERREGRNAMPLLAHSTCLSRLFKQRHRKHKQTCKRHKSCMLFHLTKRSCPSHRVCKQDIQPSGAPSIYSRSQVSSRSPALRP